MGLTRCYKMEGFYIYRKTNRKLAVISAMNCSLEPHMLHQLLNTNEVGSSIVRLLLWLRLGRRPAAETVRYRHATLSRRIQRLHGPFNATDRRSLPTWARHPREQSQVCQYRHILGAGKCSR